MSASATGSVNVIDAIIDALRPLLNLKSNDKFETDGRALLTRLIKRTMERDEPLVLVLPGFPCKSPNMTTEVLGRLPDRGEEIGLARLEAACVAIEQVYPRGASVKVFSDGRVFSQVLGVADEDVLAYKAALEQLVIDEGHSHIFFDRLDNHTTTDNPIAELKARYAVDSMDLDAVLAANAGLRNTYDSFRAFIARDLRNEFAHLDADARDSAIDEATREMIRRNVAFSNLVQDLFGDNIRLSIHAFDNAGPKFGVLLIPQLEAADATPTTPWHCVVCRNVDGTEFVAKHEDVDREAFEVVHKYGRPWFYAAKPENVPAWRELSVTVTPWRQGVTLTAAPRAVPPSIRDAPRDVLRALATKYSVVLLRGFREDEDLDTLASYLGEILMWPTGSTLELKQDGAAGLASRSHEPMAFHYDGMFKRIPGSDVLGDVPLYQFFQCFQPYPEANSPHGRTMFVDTRRLLAALPAADVERLRQLRMTATTAANVMYGSAELTHHMDVVSRHPVSGQEILRFHEPWGEDKTEQQPTFISIRKKGDGWTEAEHAAEEAWCFSTLVPLLYSDEFNYAHEWRKGDFVISDNYAQLHSRTPVPKTGREIKRIHVN
ncbi:hypothetical protein ACHHYP_01833 [Achlya hypogyna]|uniref:TauD/TfdA-like domain-containing protein n=1 Tax=Achlya hypogyna TaxID=1202772 RepID=A0A1V9ZSX3_ACHHY|nr:hypothetical protein ACHHYP_01833 [Achlya hypogyna]